MNPHTSIRRKCNYMSFNWQRTNLCVNLHISIAKESLLIDCSDCSQGCITSQLTPESNPVKNYKPRVNCWNRRFHAFCIEIKILI